MDKGQLMAAVLRLARAATDGPPPLVTPRFRLGASGFSADLAIVADEFVGVAVRGAGDRLDGLVDELATYARYFDRTLLVVVSGRHPDIADGPGDVAIWTVDADGAVVERHGGVPTEPGLAALFDLMTMDERRALLSELSSHHRVRDASPPSTDEARRCLRAGLTARFGAASDAFWASVDGCAITPSDLRVLTSVTVRLAA